MSLKLRQAIPGRPCQGVRALAGVWKGEGAEREVYYAYPSSSSVVIVHPSGDLAHTLPFWDALHRASARAGPSTRADDVKGVVGRGNTVVAWSGIHVVIWHLNAEWAVHSTVVAGANISTVDYVEGMLAVGTQNGVEVWRLADADVIVWDRVWSRNTAADAIVSIPPSRTHVAWYHSNGRTINVQALGKASDAGNRAVIGTDVQEIKLPREIEWLSWRNSSTDPYLYVIAAAVLRIYLPVLDDPSWFQLLYSFDHGAFNQNKGKSRHFGTIWVPDTQIIRSAASEALKGAENVPQSARTTLEAIEAEEMDVVFWFGPHGSFAARSIMNLDRKPPTLIQSQLLTAFETEGLEATPSSAGIALPGHSLFVGFPASSSNKDITSLCLSLPDLFASIPEAFGQATPLTDFEAMSVLMSQDISSFVRTPNGRGLLAVGQEGEIAVWEKRRVGKAQHSVDGPKRLTLVGKGQWMAPATPILYSIYAKGRGVASYYRDADGPRVVLQHLDPGDGTPSEPVPMPQFELKDGDDIKMLLAVSNIDDGYTSSRKRRTRRAVIMAVAASGEAWVWRVDPAPTSPHIDLQSPLATPRKPPTESPSQSPIIRSTSIRVDDTPVNRTAHADETPGNSPLRKTSRLAESISSDMGSSFVYRSEKPVITLISHSILPVEGGGKPLFILPVDPMGWHSSTVDWESDTPLQDMVVTVSSSGVLEFWRPRLGQHLPGHRRRTVYGDMANHAEGDADAWTRTGVVRTDKKDVVRARCSSRKKTVLVTELPDGSHEMTIWDSNVSEFSTGLELTHKFEPGLAIKDLDWTTTSDLQSVLAVGFAHHVVLVCEQRMSYVDVTPGWAPFIHIDMRKYTSVPINDSIWIAGGSLAVGVGNQVYVFSRFIDMKEVDPEDEDEDEPEDVFQLIAHRNGPLADYNPTTLHQCLLWNKIDLVKRILVTLEKNLRQCENEGRRRLVYDRLDPLDFHTPKSALKPAKAATDYSSLFSVTPAAANNDDEDFNPTLVENLIERLDGSVIIPLSHDDKSLLAAIAQATLEVDQSRRSLDLCGLRYLISIRTYVNRDRFYATSGTATPSVDHLLAPSKPSGKSMPLLPTALAPNKAYRRISFRNIVWATHSESHEVLLQAATASCENGKMTWDDAKRLGVFLWLRNPETLKAQMEVIARNRFMSNEDRDPTGCSLLYFTLGKKQVVHGLWRQAPGHKEQSMMIKFLANDFTTERWKTAAMKNAYALLSKQRYEYAAAFFMLAGSAKDAITVCLRQLNDWQLAVAIARVVEGDGPLLRWILTDTVMPIAFGGGHRWLGSWTLWMLGRRDLAVRVLISPMEDIAAAWEQGNKTRFDVGNPDNDDPSLLLLFQHLKAKTLQTAKGTSEVPAKLEFDFVLHNARVFCRMGCHALGLDLLRSWSFDRVYFPPAKAKRRPKPLEGAISTPTQRPPLSPYTPRRRTSFMLANPHARENMVMDMDVLAEEGTEPPTQASSPNIKPKVNEVFSKGGLFANFDLGARASAVSDSPDGVSPAAPGTPAEPVEVATNGDASTAKATPVKDDQSTPRRVGNLMKELRNDVQQGATEFSMDNFFVGDTAPAPPPVEPEEPKAKAEEPTSPTSPKKVGNLMKELRNNVQQGATEFSMDSFFGDSAPTSQSVKDETVESPAPVEPASLPVEEEAPASAPDEQSPPRKVGNLMKELKNDVQQGGQEFNMDNFF